MALQCKPKASLLKLLESLAYCPEVAIQTQLPTPHLVHTSPFGPVDKKRKRDKEGKIVPIALKRGQNCQRSIEENVG